ncbi:DMT family transporter [Aestuariibacter salexigens]|uniref:DMT family transporter n=1 Tax=Aestuariibacter salexigens TaxID=226010 RepID=UPI000400F975|nr:DMT family transporter [Aestuariibacter salexigens]
MDPVKRSLVSLHITMMLLGATGLFSILIPLSATDITFARSVFACVCLIIFVKLTGGSLRLQSTKDYGVALLLGVIMAVHWITYFAGMQYAGVSVGMIALFTFPVITVFLEPFFEKITLHWQDIASAITVLIGIYLIVPSTSLQNDVTLGVLIGVGSAFLYSVRNLLHRKLFSHHGGAKAMAYQTLVISVCLVLFISDDLKGASTSTLWMLCLLGTLFTALPHALIATSLKYLRVKTFSLVACMQPFYGVIFAVILLNESPTWQTLVGGVLVVSAAVYETINAHRQRPQS